MGMTQSGAETGEAALFGTRVAPVMNLATGQKVGQRNITAAVPCSSSTKGLPSSAGRAQAGQEIRNVRGRQIPRADHGTEAYGEASQRERDTVLPDGTNPCRPDAGALAARRADRGADDGQASRRRYGDADARAGRWGWERAGPEIPARRQRNGPGTLCRLQRPAAFAGRFARSFRPTPLAEAPVASYRSVTSCSGDSPNGQSSNGGRRRGERRDGNRNRGRARRRRHIPSDGNVRRVRASIPGRSPLRPA